MNIYGNGSQSFAEGLRAVRKISQARQALLRKHADDLGGSPDVQPQGWSVHRHGLWLDELIRRYENMAEHEGWEPLPKY